MEKIKMINLKEQLHEGCTVHFRCGGSAVVEKYHVSKSHLPVSLKFDEEIDNYHSFHHYKNDGTKTAKRCLDDIVKIDPKPFDWKDMKHGACFTCTNNEFWYYIYAGKCPLTGEDLFAMKRRDGSSSISAQTIEHRIDTLTRYKEGDI